MAQDQQHIDSWWAALPMLPADRSSEAYLRLRRLWHDSTRFVGRKPVDPAAARRHEFADPHHETHLTATLWENFALFHPSVWLPQLADEARFSLTGPVTACKWSYEWEKSYPPGQQPPKKMCDIIIHFRDAEAQSGVLVVEAKNLGVKDLGDKDRLPSYYLDIPELEAASPRRHLIYCFDEKYKNHLAEQITPTDTRWGIVTWQWIAALQIKLAWQFEVPEPVQRFVAGAIQYQYCQHGILPEELALPYLATEPTQHQIQIRERNERQTNQERELPLWRLDP